MKFLDFLLRRKPEVSKIKKRHKPKLIIDNDTAFGNELKR